MASNGITYDQVRSAADKFDSEGIKPTTLKVREVLMGGSFTTISKHLRAWQEERQKPDDEIPPPFLGQALQQVWKMMSEASKAEMVAVREQADSEIATAREKAEDMERERDATQKELELTEASRQGLEQQLAQEREARHQAEVELAAKKQSLVEFEHRLEDVKSQLLRESARAKTELREAMDQADGNLATAHQEVTDERHRADEALRQLQASIEEHGETEAGLREKLAGREQAQLDLVRDTQRLTQELEAAQDRAQRESAAASTRLEELLGKLDGLLAELRARPLDLPLEHAPQNLLVSLAEMGITTHADALEAMADMGSVRTLYNKLKGTAQARHLPPDGLLNYQKKVLGWLRGMDIHRVDELLKGAPAAPAKRKRRSS